MDGYDPQAGLEALVDQEIARRAYPAGFPALPEMPAGRYSAAAFHALEHARLWRRTWLYAGHVSELRDAGAYKLFDHVGLSIILSRGTDGAINAFHNICRHRGSPLLREPHGQAKRFVCPYHAWSYTLDGTLAAIPERYNFDPSILTDCNLLPVRCASWRGLIFVTVDPDAAALEDFLGAIPDHLGPDFALEEMEVKAFATIDVACNWKAAYDNFLESYHVRTVHRETLMPFLEPESFAIDLLRGGHARYFTRRKAGTLLAREGTPVVPGAPDIFRRHTIGLCMFPNLIGAVDPGGFPWVTFWPVAPNRTQIDVQLVGWNGDDSDYFDTLMAYVMRVFGEDSELLAGVQRSLDSGFGGGQKIGYTERILYWYHEEIDRVIGPQHIDPAHRVTPLLAPFAKG